MVYALGIADEPSQLFRLEKLWFLMTCNIDVRPIRELSFYCLLIRLTQGTSNLNFACLPKPHTYSLFTKVYFQLFYI